MSEILNSLWIEKYRPIKIEDLVLPERYMSDFKRIIEKCDLPNLLFSGSPGSGKCVDGDEEIEVYIEVEILPLPGSNENKK